MSRARTVLHEWKFARHYGSAYATRSIGILENEQRRKAPKLAEYKCNVDMAILSNSRFGMGMIIRDSTSSSYAGKLLIQPSYSDPQIREALCFRDALSWLKSLPYFPICVETDCQILVHALRAPQFLSSYFALIVNDCMALLRELQFISLAFIRKSANQVAHTIVRAGSSISCIMRSMSSFLI
ncbi:uncharacterized protein LOC105648176 [Jatropha curcas]|uniref:uncharacterized protein LOC105648176 n=1 Tax=Jatropha curcas TaxID=180498 RepID=UPI0005FBE1BB|nr:uncharacterized protein LOC105648176 [Jatropha curcas]